MLKMYLREFLSNTYAKSTPTFVGYPHHRASPQVRKRTLPANAGFSPKGSLYINRAFAYAIKHLNYDLWGPDHAHTGEYGAYLATCVFFSTVFHTTSTVLDPDGLSPKDAYALQKVADKIVFDHWNFSDIES